MEMIYNASPSYKRIAYFYDDEIGEFNYGKNHSMKPIRLRLTHDLIRQYGMLNNFKQFSFGLASKSQLCQFHSEDYINCLIDEDKSYLEKTISEIYAEDCPIFSNVYKYCQMTCGGSINAAKILVNDFADIAINFSGGLHHGKKEYPFGFCYANDIVLAIQELAKAYYRILYIDIDAHHADGVEEAFLTRNIDDVGHKEGKYYALNTPLKPGMVDEMYNKMFNEIFDKINMVFNPEVIVMQLGADSIAYDMLGGLNLSSQGHAKCLQKVLESQKPILLLGGGGYTIENTEYLEFYTQIQQPVQLLIEADPTIKNENTDQDVTKILEKTMKHLSNVDQAKTFTNAANTEYGIYDFGYWDDNEEYEQMEQIEQME